MFLSFNFRVTTVKLKGKKIRIKTPVCRALKKLNNVAGNFFTHLLYLK